MKSHCLGPGSGVRVCAVSSAALTAAAETSRTGEFNVHVVGVCDASISSCAGGQFSQVLGRLWLL